MQVVFYAAYNPDITYWIAKHPEFENSGKSCSLVQAIDEMISKLSTRKLTGNAGVRFYQTILSNLSNDDAIVLQRIIDRDLRCGVNIPSINKIWTGLIPVYELMLAETDPKNLVYPCYVQLKMDGLRCLITRTKNDELLLRTRGGKLITSLEAIYDDFRKVIPLRTNLGW